MTKENAIVFFQESNRETVTLFETVLNTPIPPKAKQSVEAREIAIEAIEKQVAVPVLARRYESRTRPNYYCPICNKQQKYSYKNIREGCFCERCGQRLTF